MTSTITATGNLVADPTINYNDNGRAWSNVRIAVDQGYRDRTSNQWVDTGTDYYSLAAFGPLAEKLANNFHKGDRVQLTGRPSINTYQRPDGTTAASLNVVVSTIASARIAPKGSAGPTADRDATHQQQPGQKSDPDLPPAGWYPHPDAARPGGSQAWWTGVEWDFDRTPAPAAPAATDQAAPKQAAPEAVAERDPWIEHSGERTQVLGVTREDTELHTLLKNHGFQFHRADNAWTPPAGTGVDRRLGRVKALQQAASAIGIDLTVIPPNSTMTTTAAAAPAAAAAPTAAPVPSR